LKNVHRRLGLVLPSAEIQAMVFRRKKPTAVFQGYGAGEAGEKDERGGARGFLIYLIIECWDEEESDHRQDDQ